MKKIILVIITILVTSFYAKSQFERLDSLTAVENLFNNKTDIYFSIMKRSNPKKIIKDYKAFVIVNNNDTTELFYDSIVNVKNYGTYILPPLRLVFYYKKKKYEMSDVEKYISSPVANICIIINTFCFGNKYVHHNHDDYSYHKRKFYNPDIYTWTLSDYIPKGQSDYLPDSVIIKQNHKKNKCIVPYW
jgi:hypothetical protein